MNYILGIFILLIIVLLVNPQQTHKMYESFLGKVVFIGCILYFSKHNIVMGLLLVLSIIISSNTFGILQEGMSNTVGDDNDTSSTGNEPTTIKKKVLTKDAVNTNTVNTDTDIGGVDKEDIKDSIMPKSSKSIPVTKTITDEVNPSDKEGFASYAAEF